MIRVLAAALYLATLAACDQATSSPAPREGGEPSETPTSQAFAQPTVPVLPASYKFDLATVCDSPNIGVYEVAVEDGRVTKTQRKPGTAVRIPPLQDLPTLTDLAVLARDTDVPRERVEYREGAAGVPTSLRLDPIANAVDDEQCWFVSNYESVER